MFNALSIFAHGGEVHETAVEKTLHGIAWYIELPLFILGMLVIISIFWLITGKVEKTALLTSGVLLILGFVIATYSPLIAIISITTGLITSLFFTLVGISK